MAQQKFINSSQAYKEMIRRGFTCSYPTALKWLREHSLVSQPTGKRGQCLVDYDAFMGQIKRYKIETKEAGDGSSNQKQ